MHARALCSHLWEEKSLPSCFYITKNGMIACAINTKAPALLSLYKIRAINGCEDNLNIYRDYWGIQSFTSNTSLRLFAQIGRHLSLMEVLLFFWKTNKITTRVTTWLTPARCYSSLCRSCWPFPSCTDFSNSKWQRASSFPNTQLSARPQIPCMKLWSKATITMSWYSYTIIVLN